MPTGGTHTSSLCPKEERLPPEWRSHCNQRKHTVSCDFRGVEVDRPTGGVIDHYFQVPTSDCFLLMRIYIAQDVFWSANERYSDRLLMDWIDNKWRTEPFRASARLLLLDSRHGNRDGLGPQGQRDTVPLLLYAHSTTSAWNGPWGNPAFAHAHLYRLLLISIDHPTRCNVGASMIGSSKEVIFARTVSEIHTPFFKWRWLTV